MLMQMGVQLIEGSLSFVFLEGLYVEVEVVGVEDCEGVIEVGGMVEVVVV